MRPLRYTHLPKHFKRHPWLLLSGVLIVLIVTLCLYPDMGVWHGKAYYAVDDNPSPHPERVLLFCGTNDATEQVIQQHAPIEILNDFIQVITKAPDSRAAYYIVTNIYPDYFNAYGAHEEICQDRWTMAKKPWIALSLIKMQMGHASMESEEEEGEEFDNKYFLPERRKYPHEKIGLTGLLNKVVHYSTGSRQIAARILLGYSYLLDSNLKPSAGFEKLDQILNDNHLKQYHSLCFALKLRSMDGQRKLTIPQIGKMLAERAVVDPNFAFQSKAYFIENLCTTSSGDLQDWKKKDWQKVAFNTFELALRENLKNQPYEDDPYSVRVAFLALQGINPDKKVDAQMRWLKTLNDRNDPAWKGFSYRAGVCADLATMYYHAKEYEKAQSYVMLGQSFGRDPQLECIKGAIDAENRYQKQKIELSAKKSAKQ